MLNFFEPLNYNDKIYIAENYYLNFLSVVYSINWYYEH